MTPVTRRFLIAGALLLGALAACSRTLEAHGIIARDALFMQLINGPAVNDRLRNATNRIGKVLAKKLSSRETLNELYLVTLSRLPNEAEAKAALEHVERAMNARLAWEDVQWALINSKEFLFRH